MSNKGKIKQSISAFLSHPWKKTLFIHGKWGTGKTQTIRTLLKTDELISSYSSAYASLAGINSVDELKRRILSSIFVVENGILSKVDNRIRPFLWALIDNIESFQGCLPKEIQNINLSKVSKSLLNPSLRSSAFVIVLDDAEKCKLGDSDELFSFLSFIKESTECKLILIGNELVDEELREMKKEKASTDDVELSKPENNKAITRFTSELLGSSEWKHKIVDQKLQFEMSNSDICEIFAEDDVIREKLAEILNETNVRDLRKIRKAIEAATSILHLTNSKSKGKVVKTALECAINHLHAGETDSLFQACSISAIADGLVISHINNGFLSEIDKDTLIGEINSFVGNADATEFEGKLRSIYDEYFYSFAPRKIIEEKILALMESSKEIRFVTLCNIKMWLNYWNFVNQEMHSVIDSRIRECACKIDARDAHYFTSEYHDAHFRTIARQFLSTNRPCSLMEILSDENQEVAMELAQYLDPNAAADELLANATKKIILSLNRLYKFVSQIEGYNESKQNLDAIFDNISSRSPELKERIAILRKTSGRD